MTTTELHIALNECGFHRTGTGGGCDAFIRMFNDKNAGCDPLCVFEDCPDAYIMMTQSEDPSAPEGNEDVDIGFYAENGALAMPIGEPCIFGNGSNGNISFPIPHNSNYLYATRNPRPT
jgi:hypothetical protein